MNKSELRKIIREEAQSVIRERQTLKEGFWSKVMNTIWTITGTKGGLFKAIQSQYGKDVDKYYNEIEDVNQRMKALKQKLENLNK